MQGDLPGMYGEVAAWWPILSAPEDYAEEAALYARILQETVPGARTVLELGSGGGNNASHMKAHFALTLVDRAPGMLAVSRALNPECEHFMCDMRDVRLGRTFDAVFVHDAVMYMTTEEDLARAMETAFVHLRPGGATLFVPDCTVETFAPGTDHGGHDAPDGRAMRYLEWTYDPDPCDTTFVTDFAYLLREPNGAVRTVADRHTMGLFPRETWLRLLEKTGFEARVLPSGQADGVGEMFLGIRP
jgi:SAM-dependent methyltransferase